MKFKTKLTLKTFVNNPALTICNSFCLLPLTVSVDNILISGKKIIFFSMILSTLVTVEIYDLITHVFNPHPDLINGSKNASEGNAPPTGLMQAVTQVRYAYFTIHLIGIAMNVTINQPTHLVRLFTTCRSLDRFLPITFGIIQLILFGMVVVVFWALECWLYANFRFPGGFPGGQLLQAAMYFSCSVYMHSICIAADVLFCTTAVMAHKYNENIIQALGDGIPALDKINAIFKIREVRHKELGVVQLRQMFGVACDVKQNINDAFMVQFFLTATGAFVDCTAGIFMAVQQATRKHDFDDQYFLYAWCALLLIKIIVLSTIGHTLKQDGQRTAIEIHRRFNGTLDLTTKFELVAFSQEVSHRKEPFTALNLFEIDYSLLAKIVGTVSTYLIILLQFRQSQDEK